MKKYVTSKADALSDCALMMSQMSFLMRNWKKKNKNLSLLDSDNDPKVSQVQSDSEYYLLNIRCLHLLVFFEDEDFPTDTQLIVFDSNVILCSSSMHQANANMTAMTTD